MSVTLTTRLRRAVIAALVAMTLAGAALFGSPPASAAGWQHWQLDQDWCYDSATLDWDGNGSTEDLWFDIDNDCRWDTRLYNTRGWDGFLEEATYDMNENGAPEYLIQDWNQRVGFEYLYVDRNQDRIYDFRRIIPGSDLDAITRSTTYMASSAIMHRFYMQTGQSLLFPSFPTP
jgi:hypothetical protein